MRRADIVLNNKVETQLIPYCMFDGELINSQVKVFTKNQEAMIGIVRDFYKINQNWKFKVEYAGDTENEVAEFDSVYEIRK